MTFEFPLPKFPVQHLRRGLKITPPTVVALKQSLAKIKSNRKIPSN